MGGSGKLVRESEKQNLSTDAQFRSAADYSTGKSRSSHCAAKLLICSNFRIAGLPSRTIVARLRSFGGNVIALATAERSFMMP